MARKGTVKGKRGEASALVVAQAPGTWPSQAALAGFDRNVTRAYKRTKADQESGRPNYQAMDGSSCYSITTILGQASDPEPLIGWAHRLGWSRVSLRAGRGAAAIGTACHKVIEATVLGDLTDDEFDPAYNHYRELPLKGQEEADSALRAFRDWWPTAGLTPLAVEFQMVHDRLRIGGCLDFVALQYAHHLRLAGPLVVLVDWKTSKDTYPDMLAQMGGYGLLLEEGRPNQAPPNYVAPEWVGRPLERAMLVRLPKDGGPAHVTVMGPEQLALGRECFLGAYQTVMARLRLKEWLTAEKKRTKQTTGH